MMALLLHLRRLHRAQNPTIFFSKLLYPLAHFPLSYSFVSPSLPHHFSKAFRRTLINTSLQNLEFSTLRNSCTKKRYEIINFNEYVNKTHEDAELGVEELTELARKASNLNSGDEALDLLDEGGIKPNKDLIFSAILALREEWKLAFLVFKWGEKWDCIVEKSWCLMAWVLGNHRKFGTAWSLIQDLHKSSVDSKQAILVIIDRYLASFFMIFEIVSFCRVLA